MLVLCLPSDSDRNVCTKPCTPFVFLSPGWMASASSLPGACVLSSKIKTVDLLKRLSQRLSLTAMWESTHFQSRNAAGAFGPGSILMWSRLTSLKSAEFNSRKPQVHGIQGNEVHTKGIGIKKKKGKLIPNHSWNCWRILPSTCQQFQYYAISLRHSPHYFGKKQFNLVCNDLFNGISPQCYVQ